MCSLFVYKIYITLMLKFERTDIYMTYSRVHFSKQRSIINQPIKWKMTSYYNYNELNKKYLSKTKHPKTYWYFLLFEISFI